MSAVKVRREPATVVQNDKVEDAKVFKYLIYSWPPTHPTINHFVDRSHFILCIYPEICNPYS